MAKAELPDERLIINEFPEGIEVIILAKKSFFLNLFLVFWITCWLYGEFLIIGKIFNHTNQPTDVFLVFWLCGWTLGGIFAIVMWLWNNRGREIIRISPNELRHTREFALFSRSRIYSVENIRSLRIDRELPTMDNMSEGMEFWGISGGAVAFDYGSSTRKFGLGLSEVSAKRIIDTVHSYYKNL